MYLMIYILKQRAQRLLVWNNAPPHIRKPPHIKRLSPIHDVRRGALPPHSGSGSLKRLGDPTDFNRTFLRNVGKYLQCSYLNFSVYFCSYHHQFSQLKPVFFYSSINLKNQRANMIRSGTNIYGTGIISVINILTIVLLLEYCN